MCTAMRGEEGNLHGDCCVTCTLEEAGVDVYSNEGWVEQLVR